MSRPLSRLSTALTGPAGDASGCQRSDSLVINGMVVMGWPVGSTGARNPGYAASAS